MTVEQLNRLLDKACEIITSLENNASSELQEEIDSFFAEIKYSNEIDSEIKLSADQEAQDWDTFGSNKI